MEKESGQWRQRQNVFISSSFVLWEEYSPASVEVLCIKDIDKTNHESRVQIPPTTRSARLRRKWQQTGSSR